MRPRICACIQKALAGIESEHVLENFRAGRQRRANAAAVPPCVPRQGMAEEDRAQKNLRFFWQPMGGLLGGVAWGAGRCYQQRGERSRGVKEAQGGGVRGPRYIRAMQGAR